MKILLIEDEAKIAEFVIKGLQQAGYQVDHVGDGASGLALILEGQHDLVILDVMLPKLNGFDLLRQLRQDGNAMPVIILSAKVDLPDRLLGFEIGADDYLPKPFFVEELIARIRAVGRRTGGAALSASETPSSAERTLHGLVIDSRTQRCTLNGEEIHLTPKEFELVVYLTDDPGAVYRRQDILHDVWDTNWYGTTKTLDAHVAAIRKKLGSASWIESVRGVGFRFGVPA